MIEQSLERFASAAETPPHSVPAWTPDDLVPAETPLAMPLAELRRAATPRLLPTPRVVRTRRAVVFLLTAVAVLGLCAAMAAGLARDGVSPGDALILGLFAPNIAWTAFAAATALCGVLWQRALTPSSVDPNWRPRRRTALLIPARNEDVAGLGAGIESLRRDLAQAGLARALDIFVLSDSDDALAPDEAAMAEALAADTSAGPRVFYRRRLDNARRKPGNLADWIGRWGADYAYMLIFDADSRMDARRIRALIHRMETNPGVGLIQTGVRLVGAESRFGRLQQVATRLYGGAFASGIAGWSGAEGNYWGHNALVRVRAFAAAANLPALKGAAPFGGDILSHDFIEAAWLRRAGWAVEIDPSSRGSAESGPQTLGEYAKRDRRWCQGNLQHLRVLFSARGLHPISRLHLLCGIAGYLAAPLWLGLVLATILSGSSAALVVPLLGAMALIAVQKLAGVLDWLKRRPGPRTRGIVLGHAARELAASTMLAPIVMVRQTLSVASVLTGHDCGWKPAGGARSSAMPWLEPAVAGGLMLAVLPGGDDLWQLLLLTPILLPLLSAPLVTRWLDAVPARRKRPTVAVAAPVAPFVPRRYASAVQR